MSVLNFCLAYMRLLEHTKYVVHLLSFQGKSIERWMFHNWWQNLAWKWFTFWLVYSPQYKPSHTSNLSMVHV